MQILTKRNDENNPIIAQNGTKVWWEYVWYRRDYHWKIFIQEPKKRGGYKKAKVFNKYPELVVYETKVITLVNDDGTLTFDIANFGDRKSIKNLLAFKDKYYQLMSEKWQKDFDEMLEDFQKNKQLPDDVYEFRVWVEGSEDGCEFLRWVDKIEAKTVEEAKQKAFDWVSDKSNDSTTYWIKAEKYGMQRQVYTLKRAPKELRIAGIECYELGLKEGLILVDTFSLVMMSKGYAFP